MLLHENLNEFKQTIESTAKYYNQVTTNLLLSIEYLK